MTSAMLNLHTQSRIHVSPARRMLTGPLLVAGRDDESTRGAGGHRRRGDRERAPGAGSREGPDDDRRG